MSKKIATIPKVKAIFLDLDGTLANSLAIMRSAYGLFLKQLARPSSDEEFETLNGPPLPKIIQQLKQTHMLLEEDAVLARRYYDILDKLYDESEPSLGAEELLSKATSNGCLVGVVTSNTKARTQRWLNHVGFSSMIDFIVSGDDVILGKPNPEPYITASKIAACNTSEIIAIEDSYQGVRSAADAGLKTFMVNAENKLFAELHDIEHVASLSHLAKRIF